MKSKKYNYIDVNLKNVDSNISKKIRNLTDKEMDVRKTAREQLIEMGREVLPEIHMLLKSENSLLRWEASQVAKEIASHKSIPVFISLIEDEEADIRWIATEGLIRIGRHSIRPLLQELTKEKAGSENLKNGAHHVLSELFSEEEIQQHADLLKVLSRNIELDATIPVKAHRALSEGNFK